ncbi:MAG: protein TolR [Alphaproteobacteria bacterium]|nr:protein TolR [Alphaproteobacteria bacterium]
MGASVNQGSGRSRSGRRTGAYRQMSEINVTPFVDVMLVLLIVFMVTAPLLTAGVEVNLPNADAPAIAENNNKPIEVTINSNGNVYVGKSQVSLKKLPSLLKSVAGENFKEQKVFIRGDQDIEYGKIMTVISIVNKAGFSKVALLSEPAR